MFALWEFFFFVHCQLKTHYLYNKCHSKENVLVEWTEVISDLIIHEDEERAFDFRMEMIRNR